MTETTEPTREQIEGRIAYLESLVSLPEHAVGWDTDLAVYRMALRTLDAEAQLAERDRYIAEQRAITEPSVQDLARQIREATERAESYKTMALSAARRVRDIHAIVCGGDDSLSPREQHEAIVDVLRGHHALGPWTAAEADLARKIASDPCVVSKRWPGGCVEHARIVGEEAERAERSHRTLCGDSAQFLLKRAIPWIAAMTERAELAETQIGAANAAVDALRMTVDILETDARAIRDAAMTHAVEFMRGGETAAPAIERMATALREATERAERLQRHFDEAAPEHNLPALLDLYAERERAATERAEQAERELAEALQKADVFGELIKSIFYTLNHKLERRIDRDYRKMADTVREQINDLRYIVDQRERAEKAERERDEATERAELAERERGATSAALNDLASGLRDALNGFAMVGEKWTDAVKRLRAKLAEVERERDEARDLLIAQAEGCIYFAWTDDADGKNYRSDVPYFAAQVAVPVRDFFRALREWTATSAIRARLAEVERERDEALSANDRITAMVGEVNELFVGYDDPVAAVRALIDDYRAATTARERLREALADARAKLASATKDAPAPTTDARLDCESSSLLLLSTWARRVMMRPKNRAKGVPSESVEELIEMAHDELTEALWAIEDGAPTDDILAELGDAAAIIGFAMREIEKRRKA